MALIDDMMSMLHRAKSRGRSLNGLAFIVNPRDKNNFHRMLRMDGAPAYDPISNKILGLPLRVRSDQEAGTYGLRKDPGEQGAWMESLYDHPGGAQG